MGDYHFIVVLFQTDSIILVEMLWEMLIYSPIGQYHSHSFSNLEYLGFSNK